MPSRGRPPARGLTELELRHLHLLMETRQRASHAGHHYDEALEEFVLELREGGASARGIADALGVSSSAVHAWTKNARSRRGQ